jgi:hypothetical protein
VKQIKGTYLDEFEELVLLTVGILFDDAYRLAIVDELEKQTGRTVRVVQPKPAVAAKKDCSNLLRLVKGNGRIARATR